MCFTMSCLSLHAGRYFTCYQKDQLMKAFIMNAYPDTACQRSLAQQLGLTTEQVKVWFANKRTRDRKKALVFPNLQLFWKDLASVCLRKSLVMKLVPPNRRYPVRLSCSERLSGCLYPPMPSKSESFGMFNATCNFTGYNGIVKWRYFSFQIT